jgi:hypothetical protein
MSLVRLTCSCPDDPDFDTFLAPRRASKPCHDGPMEQVRGETSPDRRRMHGALAGKRAADTHALALLPTIRKLMAAGFVSQRGLANELNRRGIPGAVGGRWHRTSVARMLTRLDLLMSERGGTNSELASKRVADVRAEALRPTIRKLRKAGFVSITAITRELNERGIPTARGGKWRLTTVTRLLERLERLEAFKPNRATRTSDAEPKVRPSSLHRR